MMRWLLTYADMITLLLALFIILFAISNISAAKFNRLAREITGGFSSTSSINNPPNGGTTGSERGRTEDANMGSVKAQLDKYIARQNLQSKVQTLIAKQGLVITLLSDKAYYASGSADLRPETKQLLDVVANYVPAPSADEKKAPQAFVWKTIADPFAGRINVFRVLSGRLSGDTTVVNARAHAALTPHAVYRDPITIEDVNTSRLIAEPLTKLHCCIRSDGGGAVVLTSGDRARDLARPPVWVLGTGEAVSHTSMSEWPDFTDSPARRAGESTAANADCTATHAKLCHRRGPLCG